MGELDPVIQRVIARCVEENPDARPSSIHAVIASLPGGVGSLRGVGAFGRLNSCNPSAGITQW